MTTKKKGNKSLTNSAAQSAILFFVVLITLKIIVQVVLFVFQRPRRLVGYLRDGPQAGFQVWRLTTLRAVTQRQSGGDRDYCLSWSHFTDMDPTNRERVLNLRPPDQESCAPPTELLTPRAPPPSSFLEPLG